MPKGPKTPQEAKRWIREAMADGMFLLDGHVRKRMRERRVDILDIHAACERCSRVEAYPDETAYGDGTSWRLFGPDSEHERTLGVGFRAFLDPLSREMVLLCTVLIVKDGRS